MRYRSPLALILASTALVCAPSADADVAFDNFGPGSTFTGNGFLVRGPQFPGTWWTHAFPITPALSGQVTTVTVAMHHLEGTTNSYIFELRADAAGSPGPLIAVLGKTAGFISGDVPVQFSANPGTSIVAGTTYWVYARGQSDTNGTWRTSPNLGGLRAFSFDGGASFTVLSLGATGSQGAIRIEVAGSACYANCDGSTVQPVLTANDFQCFINAYAAGASTANCDGSTVQPVLTANDFQCFINKYAAGCS